MVENRPFYVSVPYFPLQRPRSYKYNISGVVFCFVSYDRRLASYKLQPLLHQLPCQKVIGLGDITHVSLYLALIVALLHCLCYCAYVFKQDNNVLRFKKKDRVVLLEPNEFEGIYMVSCITRSGMN